MPETERMLLRVRTRNAMIALDLTLVAHNEVISMRRRAGQALQSTLSLVGLAEGAGAGDHLAIERGGLRGALEPLQATAGRQQRRGLITRPKARR